jgi:pyrophosphatase PpaX
MEDRAVSRIEYILFDLDGTLIDTTPLIVESFKHTFLFHHNIEKKEEEVLEFLGLPLRAPFERLHPGMEEEMMSTYRKFNEEKHDGYVGLFVDIVYTLDKLKEKGICLGVVTSKRRELAMRGMRLFGIEKYMSVFVGLEDTEKHKPEGEPLIKALDQLGVKKKEKVLYVGDSPYDVLCAKNAGVRSAAIGWSYINRKALDKVEPEFFFERPKELLALVEKQR